MPRYMMCVMRRVRNPMYMRFYCDKNHDLCFRGIALSKTVPAPDATIHVERVRHTKDGGPDKWRNL